MNQIDRQSNLLQGNNQNFPQNTPYAVENFIKSTKIDEKEFNGIKWFRKVKIHVESVIFVLMVKNASKFPPIFLGN